MGMAVVVRKLDGHVHQGNAKNAKNPARDGRGGRGIIYINFTT